MGYFIHMHPHNSPGDNSVPLPADRRTRRQTKKIAKKIKKVLILTEMRLNWAQLVLCIS